MNPNVIADTAVAGITPGKNHFYSVRGGFAAYLIFRYSQKNPAAPIVVVCPTHREMENMAAELGFFLGEQSVCLFPNWEILPYDLLSPDKTVVSNRLKTLDRISHDPPSVVVTTVQAYYSRMLPVAALDHSRVPLSVNRDIAPADLAVKLVAMGYSRVDQVEEAGEFSLRGDIMDIFSGDAVNPLRIDFFDNTIERLRLFNPETQRSIEDTDAATVYAVHEVFPDEAGVAEALNYLREQRKNLDPDYFNELTGQIGQKAPFSGIEPLLPLFYRSPATLTAFYFETPTVFFKDAENCERVHQDIYDEIVEELELALKQRKVTPPLDKLFFAPKSGSKPPVAACTVNLYAFFPKESAGKAQTFEITDNSLLVAQSQTDVSQHSSPAHRILAYLQQSAANGSRVILTANDAKQVNLLKGFLEEDDDRYIDAVENPFLSAPDFFSNPPEGITVISGGVLRGFQIMVGENAEFCVVSTDEIFSHNVSRSRKKKTYRQTMNELEKIAVNDYVVHQDHGIGVYRGLQKISVDDTEEDFLVVEFNAQGKIYVPVDHAGVLTKWSGVSGGTPRLNTLGDKNWTKTKARVTKKVEDMAEELVALYAKRKLSQGVAFDREHPLLDEFQMRFAFQETEDQLSAIDDIFADMSQPTPMDRLVCGDVGFGKTEVAMRAACKAVLQGYQVAVLVPTTVLATQHYETFKDRFAFMPVNIGSISRMNTAAGTKEMLRRLAEGKLDILIGTHRILSKDVTFQKLGLLIVDEEQRFGVKDKEKIRGLRVNVDTLTLTATPIPRTLHMSLMGIRDISVINTPPVERRSIKTRVIKYNMHVIAEAVERELRRNGQVFFIHNRVETIDLMRSKLLEIMPHVSIRVAHGQMSGSSLEEVMLDFLHKRFTVLLATTIVESGLDIPNANTIIINNADRFGLAQLYQLRGRVGRSQRQAYAYFMMEDEERLSETALKRLNVIRELTELGSGFKISSYDLEIRGAGNLLGAEQSGDIDGIGINLYIAMIEEAVERIRGETPVIVASQVKLDTDFPVGVPSDYIAGDDLRLELYRNIAECTDAQKMQEISEGLLDRFGSVPEPVSNLLQLSTLKHFAGKIGAVELSIGKSRSRIRFGESFSPNITSLMQFIGAHNGRYRKDGSVEFLKDFTGLQEADVFIRQFAAAASAGEPAPG